MPDSVLQHFRNDESGFIETASGWIQEAGDQNRPILTNFLNPREIYILETLVNRVDTLKMDSFGGYQGAELQRALIYPDYFISQPEDFEITTFDIVYPIKFAELQHRQVLGTLANLGIERNTFGDIISNEDAWQFFVTKDLADFFSSEVTRIGKIKVKLVEAENVVIPTDDWETEVTTFASKRLDAIVAGIFNLSRHHAKELIEAKKVRLNWEVIEKSDAELEVNDILSVRGYGRIQISALQGETKKGKLRMEVKIIRNNK
ncbi:YlmH/Sll1252 family protein [Pediococcus argentinicus]|uniref:YlmH family RNA-binding protein n=1 Tax=Pediococcus argentinicus TaxID=480391 RepID=UPI00338F0889